MSKNDKPKKQTKVITIRIDEELKPLKKRYLAGKETNIAGVIRGDGAEKDNIDILKLIYQEPTAVYLREEY